MSKLNGKIAVVTGASGGIGQAVAVRLAADGADVALFGQNVERLQETAGKVKALGRRAECYQVDNKSADAITGVTYFHIPPLEAQMLRSRGDRYRDYQSRTSAFFPLPPRA